MNPTFPAPNGDVPEQSDVEAADSQADTGSPGWVVSSSPTSRSSSLSSKRSEGSGLSKVIPPVLGGLAAIPIAIAILWYGFGKDLGNAGPTVARYIPAIVPKHLRGGPFRDDGTLGRYDSYDSEGYDNPFPPASRASTGEASDLPSLSESSTLSKSAESVAKDEQTVAPNLAPENLAPDISQPSTTEIAPGDVAQTPSVAEQETAAPATKPTIKDAILLCEELQSKLKELWPSADSEQRQAMAREFYSACLSLADQVTSQKGISLQAWKRELDSWSRGFLKEPAFPRLWSLCLDGKIEGLPPHQNGDAILLIEAIGKPETESTDWQIATGLNVNGEKVMLLIPEAVHRKYLAQATEEPKQSLVIGVWQKNESQAPSIEAVYVAW
jgi:hypothetical protein